MKLAYHQLTSQGDREINQDCMAYRVDDDFAVFVVADGLGGHQAGEKASRFFCHGLIKNADAYAGLIDARPAAAMSLWIDAAVEEMRNLFEDDPLALGAHTTCAILYLDKKRVLTAHCGDSRVYRLNPREIVWRTRDHSVLQGLLEEGKITEIEMGGHPEQNCLLRSINVAKGHESEINAYPAARSGDTFVLCSDGFWENVKAQELLQLAQPDSGINELGKAAKLSLLRANGKSDNITVQWVRCLSP
ncbi:protein phosphatase 2C domain-containing protein [Methylomicrobium sp. Wu6]|uniref:PP2C family protein-serine/threonine phosphatase n=1 Tax=Methylomicrobium sp. Wu6 TaxID=3107928 RepID=UPI002DD652D1|nr:protein phosphatase 2C domain-containing protein [Methylomicrobium sp. Wu6]MEC4748639.1 protein phosphatase 2C domain-containing protein [Methylomicrobium sp. Wu6]